MGAYGPNTFYFDFLSLQQEVEVGGGTLTARAGQLTALSDFLVSGPGGYYVNEAFQADVLRGIDVLATYEPESSWGAFVKDEQPAWYVQTGLYQVSDRIGDTSNHRLDYSIQPDDGDAGCAVHREPGRGRQRPRRAGSRRGRGRQLLNLAERTRRGRYWTCRDHSACQAGAEAKKLVPHG